jgi:hypothetical protein
VLKFIVSIFLYTTVCSAGAAQTAYHSYAMPFLFSAKTSENFSDAFNAAFNPSLIPYIHSIEVATCAEKKYLTNINVLLLTVCAPFRDNGASLVFQRYGNTLFSESTLGLGYGKKIGAVNAGINFQHIRVKIKGAQDVSLIKVGIASSIKLSDNVFAGCRITNPNLFAKRGPSKLHAASSFSLSIGWDASPEVYAGIESLKDEGQPLSLIFSLQYHFAEEFSCALNWNTYSNQPHAAFSWRQNQLTIEAGCSYHATLGMSPLISLLFKKHTEK